MEVGGCPTYRTQRVLTHKVTDGGELPVFLHAHVTTVAGFKCHPPAMPFHFKHGVGRTKGRADNISERGEQSLSPFSPWIPGMRWKPAVRRNTHGQWELLPTPVNICYSHSSMCMCLQFQHSKAEAPLGWKPAWLI